MPLVPFSKEIAQDVALLHRLSADVVREFTKLALSGIQTGAVNQKMYSKAAESLELDSDAVKKSIEGIVAIFLECSKRATSKEDFELSLLDLRFNAESQQILSEAFVANFKEIRSHLSESSLKLAHYADIDWRLDVQLGSRALRKQCAPSLLVELHTSVPNHDGSGSQAQKQMLQMDYANLKHVCAELEDAVAQLKSGHCRRIQKYIR